MRACMHAQARTHTSALIQIYNINARRSITVYQEIYCGRMIIAQYPINNYLLARINV